MGEKSPTFLMGRKPLNRTNCSDCYVGLDDSNRYSNGMGSYSPRCRKCHAVNSSNSRLKRIYGINSNQYDVLLFKQMGGCAICKLPCSDNKSLAVDHNHTTSEVRGLLCRRCNTVIGLMNENEDLFWDMLEYLKRTTWKSEVA